MSEVDYSEFLYETKPEVKPKLREKPQKAVSPKITEPRETNRVIAVLVIIACFCLTLLSADYLSGGYILAEFDSDSTVSSKECDYYAVQTGMYSDQKTAELYAKNIRARGGAGYVYYDGIYRVVASVYSEALQARSVAEKMEQAGINATIFPITLSPISDSSISSEDRATLLSASECAGYCYESLYELSNAVDAGIVSEEELSSRLASLLSYLESHKLSLDEIDHSSVSINLSSSIKGAIEIIKSVPQSPSSSDLRYAYSAILAGRA